jgi:hypothetical protein
VTEEQEIEERDRKRLQRLLTRCWEEYERTRDPEWRESHYALARLLTPKPEGKPATREQALEELRSVLLSLAIYEGRYEEPEDPVSFKAARGKWLDSDLLAAELLDLSPKTVADRRRARFDPATRHLRPFARSGPFSIWTAFRAAQRNGVMRELCPNYPSPDGAESNVLPDFPQIQSSWR